MCFVMAETPRDPYFLLCDVLKVTRGAEGVTHGTPGPGGCTCVQGGGTASVGGRDVPALTWHWLLPVTPQQLTQSFRLEKAPKSLSPTIELEAQSIQSSPWTHPTAVLANAPSAAVGPRQGQSSPGLCHPWGQGSSSPEHSVGTRCRAVQTAHVQEGIFYTHSIFTPRRWQQGGFPQPKGEWRKGASPQTKEPLSRSGGQEGRGAAALMWQRAGTGAALPRDERALPRVPREPRRQRGRAVTWQLPR